MSQALSILIYIIVLTNILLILIASAKRYVYGAGQLWIVQSLAARTARPMSLLNFWRSSLKLRWRHSLSCLHLIFRACVAVHYLSIEYSHNVILFYLLFFMPFPIFQLIGILNCPSIPYFLLQILELLSGSRVRFPETPEILWPLLVLQGIDTLIFRSNYLKLIDLARST